MKITWYGHSAFRVESGGRQNPDRPVSGRAIRPGASGWEGPAEGVTHVLLTHGHNDHVSGALAILKKSGAMLVANYEICMFLVGQGRPAAKRSIPAISAAPSIAAASPPPSSRRCTPRHLAARAVNNTYLGNPGGLVLHFPEDKTLYHMGDTDIFSDMALINELHEPKIGIVPVGDRFTMGGAVAALACRRFFRFDTVVPCHFGTFPIIDQTAEKFVAGMEGSGVDVALPGIGQTITL